MNELQAILTAFETHQQRGETTFLATIVNTQGSTYRRPGARLLMTSTGQRIGMISGGCLENDVFEQTQQRMQSGEPLLVTYDTTADVDIVWGFGLGCNGVVQVLIERLEPHNLANPLQLITKGLRDRGPCVLATVFHVEGSLSIKVGMHWLFQAGQEPPLNLAESALALAITSDAQSVLQRQRSTVNQYELPTGKVLILLEAIQPPTPTIIFGAGQDAIPVAHLAKSLGWHVTVVDCRANEASIPRFSMADQVLLTRREKLHQTVAISDQTVAIAMTHNYLDDLAILKLLLPSPVRYLGALGSKQRTERLLRELQIEGIASTDKQCQRLYAPIGFDIGAETPEAIALSIVAEIQAVLANRSGCSLRNRLGAIHQTYESIPTQQHCFDHSGSGSFDPDGNAQTTVVSSGT
jgi:xanthine/CO dehydrogenase XdhC/CoxF family maturation factor